MTVTILSISSINCAAILPIDTAFVKSDRVGNDFSYSIQENRGLLAAAIDPLTLQPQQLLQQPQQQALQPPAILNRQGIISEPKISLEQAQQQQSLQQPLLQINHQQSLLQSNGLNAAPKLTPLQPAALPLQSLPLTSAATLPINYIQTGQYAYAYPYLYPFAYNLIKS